MISQKAKKVALDSPTAAMAVTKLPSMLRPILPPGCGFAVIDADQDIEREGEVIFHSRSERNGAENFLVECEDASELKGAILSDVPQHFTARYRGQQQAMYLHPLEDLPWHIVVFQEKELLETVRFEAIEMALVFLLLEALLLVLALWVIRQMFPVDFQPRIVSFDGLKTMPYRHLVLAVPPRTETGDAFADADVKVDFSNAGNPGGERELDKLRHHLRGARFVRIDHLERLLAVPSARADALPLFEAALAKTEPGPEIVAFSYRDPVAVLDAEQSRLSEESVDFAQRDVLERWRSMLDRFMQEKTLPDQEPFDGKRKQRTDDDYRADSDDYRAVWWALRRDDRHVLTQIANHSMVKGDLDQPLRRLLGWGLIERVQLAWRVKNKQFRKFVLDQYDHQALRDWENEAAIGLWRHVPFYWALGLVVLFLLVTQRELFDVSFGLVSTAAGSLAAVIKIFDSLRKASPRP